MAAMLALGGCTDPASISVARIPLVTPVAPVPPAEYFIVPTPTPIATPTPRFSPQRDVLRGPLQVGVAADMPDAFAAPMLAILSRTESVEAANGTFPLYLLDQPDNATVVVELKLLRAAGIVLAERYYAVVVPFATVRDDITLEEVQMRHLGLGDGPLIVPMEDSAAISSLLGEPAAQELGQEISRENLLAALEETAGAVGILPFDRLDPRFKVLTIDGVDVLSNRFDNHSGNRTDAGSYPLAVALHVRGEGAGAIAELLAPVIEPYSNRDGSRLTSLIMTGVTAISRGTAAAIERNGALYPAAMISDTLAAADITHVSNEVPFLDDCVVNNTLNNLVLCSHTDYWATLEAVGTDIVGLSGNHVNDFGREGARRSLQFYRDNEIPIYGSGLNLEEACAPLRWEHNGNTFAFVAVLAFGPETAWASDELPGACYYYDHKEMILELVETLAEEVDLVSVELQYLETYDPVPTNQQVVEFRELRAAGADIVTGVQSHVPQAMEPYGMADEGGPGILLYGLGNLFFDQMWSWETRTELIVRHTIYEGRTINTQVLTAVLEDFSQPRWADEDERRDILTRVFDAAPRRPQ